MNSNKMHTRSHSKRSTGDPYLPSKSMQKIYPEVRLAHTKTSGKLSNNGNTEIQRDQDVKVQSNLSFDHVLSADIALAVATIVAESELTKNVDTTPEESCDDDILQNGQDESSPLPSPKPVTTSTEHLAPTKNESSTSATPTAASASATTFVPPTPTKAVKMGSTMELQRYLGRVQNYMNGLGYHREGEPAIRINPRLSMKMQMVTAKDIIKAGLPIKCLHAVVLAVYFTNCAETMERFPIYFRSHVAGKEYKHIVLGIYVHGHFGALGISRDTGLQDKKTVYGRLSELVLEFANCYDQSRHILNEVKFGNIITHDQLSLERLFSKNGSIPIHGSSKADIETNVEKFAKQLRAKMGVPCLKAARLEAQLPYLRLSRSKSTLNANNTLRIRTLSVGPVRRDSEESVNTRSVSKSRPPKSKKK